MISNFLQFKTPDISKNSRFLFYGENHGRVEECSSLTIKSIKEKFGKISVVYYSNDDLKKEFLLNYFLIQKIPIFFLAKTF